MLEFVILVIPESPVYLWLFIFGLSIIKYPNENALLSLSEIKCAPVSVLKPNTNLSNSPTNKKLGSGLFYEI